MMTDLRRNALRLLRPTALFYLYHPGVFARKFES
jgi:hypothetical protein